MFLLVPAHPGSPGPTAIKRLCVCVCVCVRACVFISRYCYVFRALFDYDPTHDAGLPGRGLDFKFGHILNVVGDDDADWWHAVRVVPDDGGSGVVPSKRRSDTADYCSQLSNFIFFCNGLVWACAAKRR